MFRLPRLVSRRTPHRSLLNLEALEDRCLLAVEPLSLADLNLIASTGGGQSQNAVTNASGRYVAYESTATNLIANQNDTNLGTDIFLFDRDLGMTTLVSHAAGAPEQAGNGASFDPRISADGQFIVYSTLATDLAAGVTDTNTVSDVYVFDRVAGTTTLVSRSAASATTTATGTSTGAVISGDGNFIAFVSDAPDVLTMQSELNDGNDVFLFNRANGMRQLVSRSSASPLTTGNGVADSPAINFNGDFVAFRSDASDLVTNDGNIASDVFLFSRTVGTTSLLSRIPGSSSTTANNASFGPVIDNDGNYIAFVSLATNLVGGSDSNDATDVFVFDRANGSNALVSHALGSLVNAPAAGASSAPSISGDGGFIAYVSEATANSIIGGSDTNNAPDVFLYNRMGTGNTLVSRNSTAATTAASGASDSPVISNDNAFIAFRSTAPNILSTQADNNNAPDIFLYQRSNGNRFLVSHNQASSSAAGNGASSDPALSAEGRYVAYTSASTDLQAGVTDTNGFTDIFLYNRIPLTSNTLSLRNADLPSDTAGGDSVVSSAVDLTSGRTTSADGRFVVFVSTATNLAPNQIDINFTTDVFLRDQFNGTTTLVSHLVGSADTAANAPSFAPVISRDGQWIAFLSEATNLVPGQTDGNDGADVFLFNRLDGSVTLVSGVAGSATTTANAPSTNPILSGNGNLVVFTSAATDLVAGQNDNNSADDVFAFDRTTGTTRLVSGVNGSAMTTANAASDDPSVSNDGSLIAFRSDATNVVNGVLDTNSASDVFLFNRTTGVTSLVSRSAASATTPANNASDTPRLSADGSTVVFSSLATNLVTGQTDNNGVRDVFLFDRATGARVLVSHVAGLATTTGNGASTAPSTSTDGGFIAFSSLATNLVAGLNDNNNDSDVFLFARQGGSIILVSRAAADPTSTANGPSAGPRISANGSTVAFRSDAIDLVTGQMENNDSSDVFAFNRLNGVVMLASQSLASPAATANSPATRFDVNGDGGVVVFNTPGNNLVANDRNSGEDVFAFLFNRAPLGIALDNNTVPEKMPPGLLVGNFVTNDPDSLDTFTYQFVAGPGDSGNASFVIVGSELRTNVSLDAGATPTLSIRVRSTDSGGLSVEQVLTVVVLDVNETPTDIAIVPDTVPENSPVGTVVGMFVTTDPDPNQTFTYALVAGAGDADNALFAVSGQNLVTGAVFDFETRNTFFIRVRSTDQGGLFVEKSLIVNIGNVDEAPTDIQLTSNRVIDGSPPGTPVGQLIAVDPDQNDTFTFILVAGPGDNNNPEFQINGNTLEVAETPRFAAGNLRSIRVRVTDSGGLSFEKVLTIVVGPNFQPETVGMFDPASGTWFLRKENSSGPADAGTFAFGGLGWDPVVGDWNGDGDDTIGVVDRTGASNPTFAVWYLRNHNSGGAPDIQPFAFGLRGWVPVVGDWDGDGVEGIGMVDPSTGIWYLRNTPSPGLPDFSPFFYGLPGWTPIAGDWDGDGRDSIGVIDPSLTVWYLRNTVSPGLPDFDPFAYGIGIWKPVVGDWDGNGSVTPGVVDTAGNWLLRNSNSPGGPDITPFAYGVGFWSPVSGTYNRRQALPQKTGLFALEASALGDGAVLDGLDPSALGGTVTTALQRLAAEGIDPATLDRIAAAQVVVANLPGNLLGLADPALNRIWIDSDAAGWGWFVDQTPNEDSEFAGAVQGMDLLSTVAHELGHLAGLQDLQGADHAGDLMGAALQPGQRRVRTLDALFSNGL
jgi:hypothetical protein